MGSVFNWIRHLAPAGFVLKAIVGSVTGIVLLLVFVLGRRTYRQRYFRRRDARTFAIRNQWDDILKGAVPAGTWWFDAMDRAIVKAILLDSVEVAPPDGIPRLLAILRSSGLLDMSIYEVRASRGWRRQRALVSLGQMRAPEGIPALAEALDDPNPETRAAAVRGLGLTRLPEAAPHILERVMADTLRVPARVVQAALVNCCQSQPRLLLPYLHEAEDQARALLARVLAEMATPDMGDDLFILAGDPQAEVRASTARALGAAQPSLALPTLSALASDSEWFVRLRGVAALGELEDPRAIPALVRALCDANRYVRLRSAASLGRLDACLEGILEQVVETRDPFALQAMISELERSGQLQKLAGALTDPVLVDALRAGLRQLRGAATRASQSQPEKVTGR